MTLEQWILQSVNVAVTILNSPQFGVGHIEFMSQNVQGVLKGFLVGLLKDVPDTSKVVQLSLSFEPDDSNE